MLPEICSIAPDSPLPWAFAISPPRPVAGRLRPYPHSPSPLLWLRILAARIESAPKIDIKGHTTLLVRQAARRFAQVNDDVVIVAHYRPR